MGGCRVRWRSSAIGGWQATDGARRGRRGGGGSWSGESEGSKFKVRVPGVVCEVGEAEKNRKGKKSRSSGKLSSVVVFVPPLSQGKKKKKKKSVGCACVRVGFFRLADMYLLYDMYSQEEKEAPTANCPAEFGQKRNM